MPFFSRLFQLGVSFGILTIASCECQRAESQAKAYPRDNSPPVYASDLVELDDIRDFYRRVFGRDEYTRLWSELERWKQAQVDVDRIPHQDSWYPEVSKGTNINGALTRYDQAFNKGEAKAELWEAQNHNRLVPDWYGHCNGTGVAVSRYQNPVKEVNRPVNCVTGSAGCVTFSPQDIRALLSEINMNAKAKFISGDRCRLSAGALADRPIQKLNPQAMDECDDVNPGSFHVGLINFLGRMKQPIIFDEHRDEEVWNYPIYAYSFESEGPFTELEAVNILRNETKDSNGNILFPPMDSWIFNPLAVSFRKIKMTVSYRNAPNNTGGAGEKPAPSIKIYDYILELNEANEVIGGEWIGNSRFDHPDFIWMAFEPATPTGENSRGNPFLSNAEVIKIWAESVGFNPERPFQDKPKNKYDVRFYPSFDLDWGRVSTYYSLILDGKRTGAVFLGKKTHLRLEVADILKTGANVELLLNGQNLPATSLSTGRMDLVFDASPGLNLLSLRWQSNLVSSMELNWDFSFFAM